MRLCVCCLYLAVAGRADALADTSSSVDESADGQQSATTTSAAPPAAAAGGSGAASTVCGDDLQLLSCHDAYIYVRTQPLNPYPYNHLLILALVHTHIAPTPTCLPALLSLHATTTTCDL
jgi:hypothetical protein